VDGIPYQRAHVRHKTRQSERWESSRESGAQLIVELAPFGLLEEEIC
jgi:hypothetical protein